MPLSSIRNTKGVKLLALGMMSYLSSSNVEQMKDGTIWFQGDVTPSGCKQLVQLLMQKQAEHFEAQRAALTRTPVMQVRVLDLSDLFKHMSRAGFGERDMEQGAAASKLQNVTLEEDETHRPADQQQQNDATANSPANEATSGAALELPKESEPIDVYIMSVGGHMHACLAAVDEMVAMQQLCQTIKGFDGKLHTVWARQIRTHCFGYCASAGAMLLLGGRHRRVGPNDRVLMHQPSAGAGGGLDEMYRQLQNIESLTATAYEIILKRCNVSEYAYWTNTSKTHLVFVKNCYCTGAMWHNQLRVVSVEGGKEVAYTRQWLESQLSQAKKDEFDKLVVDTKLQATAEAAAKAATKAAANAGEAVDKVDTFPEVKALSYEALEESEKESIVEGFEPGTDKKQRLRPVLVKVTEPSSEYEIVDAPEPGQQVVHFRSVDEKLQEKWVSIITSARGPQNPTMGTFDEAFKQLMESDLYLGARECSDMGVSTEGSDETFTPHWRSMKTIV